MSDPHPDIPRPLAEVLGDLVALAERVLQKPYLGVTRIDLLAAEVEAWIRRPADGARLIDERAAWLIHALRQVGSLSATPERARWHDLAITLTEHAMASLAAALDAERRPSP